ncbi:MAG: hypothetical protein R2753_12935, partial [Chitinophagales bacterium]
MQSIFFEKNKLSFIALVIIPILVVIIYGQTLNFSYNIDDEYYINQLPEQNTTFFEKLASINQPFNQSDFRPVTYTTFLIESTFFGKSAKVFHLFNLIYYSILCFTIFLIFQFIFRTAKIELASYIALLIAVLFLLHPSHANVVASIKNRESILSLSFALWALYFWIHFLKQTKPIRLVYFFLCIGILLLSIFAKVESIVFLLILPVTGYFIVPYFFDRRKVFATLISVAVFFIVCLVLVFIIKDIPNYQLDNASIVTADESPIDFTTSMIKRWAVTFHTFFMYEMFMIYPKGYYFYFGYDTIDLWTYKNIWPYLFGVIHLVFLIFLIALTKKRNIYALGPLIFFIAIFPFLNLFISVAGIVAVRYSFIASLGFCMALAQLIFCLYSRLKKYNIGKPVIAITTLSILILYGYFSRQRAQVWKDRVTLFNHDLPYLEKSVVANRMACTYYIDKYVNDKDWKNEQTLKKVIEYADNALKV